MAKKYVLIYQTLDPTFRDNPWMEEASFEAEDDREAQDVADKKRERKRDFISHSKRSNS